VALLIDYNSDNETITLRNGNGRNIGKHYWY
jgi:hypothetical protein